MFDYQINEKIAKAYVESVCGCGKHHKKHGKRRNRPMNEDRLYIDDPKDDGWTKTKKWVKRRLDDVGDVSYEAAKGLGRVGCDVVKGVCNIGAGIGDMLSDVPVDAVGKAGNWLRDKSQQGVDYYEDIVDDPNAFGSNYISKYEPANGKDYKDGAKETAAYKWDKTFRNLGTIGLTAALGKGAKNRIGGRTGQMIQSAAVGKGLEDATKLADEGLDAVGASWARPVVDTASEFAQWTKGTPYKMAQTAKSVYDETAKAANNQRMVECPNCHKKMTLGEFKTHALECYPKGKEEEMIKAEIQRLQQRLAELQNRTQNQNQNQQ